MSESIIEDIKRNLTAEDVIRRAATDWKDESSPGRVGRCTHPEHGHTSDDSNTGNLIVTEEGDSWYCYSHDSGGDVLSWVAMEMGLATCNDPTVSGDAFVEVLEEAADRAGVEFEMGNRPDSYEEAVELDTISDERKARYALDEAVDILHDNLNKIVGDVTVRKLIRDNRPFDDELIDELRIGYLDGEAYAELLRRLSEDALKDIGIMRENGRQHGDGRIIYPYNPRGLPSFWVGRRTENSSMDAKYLKPAREATILEEPIYEWGTAGTSLSDGVWITEGIQDAVALSEAGSLFAVSPVAKDTSAHQRDLILERAREEGRAIVCYDSDEGGMGGAVNLALDIMSTGVQTDVLQLPEGTDPCDYFFDGGDFSDLTTRSAAVHIIETKGDSDAVVGRILDTVSAGTPRADRLVTAISEVTPLRRDTLRNMITAEREFEHQQGWREPVTIRKTRSADPEFTFVYADGSEITMSSIGDYGSASTFIDKFGQKFNYFPDIKRSDFIDMVNEWLGSDRIETVDVDPLTKEGRTRERVQEAIQEAQAVGSRYDLKVAGWSNVALDEGAIMVHTDTVKEWVENIDINMAAAGRYLDPIKLHDTEPRSIDGNQYRFWFFDPEIIQSNGYSIPDPKGVPEDYDGEDADDRDEDGDDEVREL